MGFLFRILRSQFVKHLLNEGLEIIERDALEQLQANQKKRRGANKVTTEEGSNNG